MTESFCPRIHWKKSPPAIAPGTGQEHERGVGQVVIGQVEDQEDQGDDDGHDDHQGSPRSDLVLELAGPFQKDAFGKLDFAVDSLAGFGDELDGVAVLHVQPDVIAEQAVLSLDRRRPLGDHDVGDLAEWDLPDRGSWRFRSRPVWAVTSRLRIAFSSSRKSRA